MAMFLTEDGLLNVFGSAGILVKSRVSGNYDIAVTLCECSCLGKECYSSNPGCKLEEMFPELPFEHWNKLLGLNG